MTAVNLIFDLLLLSALVLYACYWLLLWRLLAGRPFPVEWVSQYANVMLVVALVPVFVADFALGAYRDHAMVPSAILLYLMFASALAPAYRLTLASASGPSQTTNLKYLLTYGVLFTLVLALAAFRPELWYRTNWTHVVLTLLLLPFYYVVLFSDYRSRTAPQ
ncbi:hypothetical protein [Oceanithermus desulfurans]|uniref:Uncharacterized protein n=2 Tax=Oceanithermus desulfurans TaxID=227924 RepID=A0A511RIT7_9DEIN|nr:hypothetical protein [Oceanithermus desulfurans]MBB6030188.1 glucan phosphoethanolaminetransferase (alkaline phosphatase superfamily) [Oceanithermus desulfurans]GEM88746.1 hypothetical protein ODE01S_01800 [Oceanithermus desulfurans NBRC 100063]